MNDKARIAKKHLSASLGVVNATLTDDSFAKVIVQIGELVVNCLRSGGKVLFAGNGGSAADAQHIAGEFVSRLNYDRDPIAGIALTTDSSVLTAIGNDYGYEQVFSRQGLRVWQSRRHTGCNFHVRSVAKYSCCGRCGDCGRHSHGRLYWKRRIEIGRSLPDRAARTFDSHAADPTSPHYGRTRNL